MKLYKDINGETVQMCALGDTIWVDGTSASAQSAVLHATNWTPVQLACTANLNIAMGTNPTATTSSILLPAGSIINIAIQPGHKIACLGGKLNITVLI